MRYGGRAVRLMDWPADVSSPLEIRVNRRPFDRISSEILIRGLVFRSSAFSGRKMVWHHRAKKPETRNRTPERKHHSSTWLSPRIVPNHFPGGSGCLCLHEKHNRHLEQVARAAADRSGCPNGANSPSPMMGGQLRLSAGGRSRCRGFGGGRRGPRRCRRKSG